MIDFFIQSKSYELMSNYWNYLNIENLKQIKEQNINLATIGRNYYTFVGVKDEEIEQTILNVQNVFTSEKVNLYKKQNIKGIEWVDITNNRVAEKNTSKDNKTLLRRLHVEEDGQVFGGAKAFLLVWKKIPKYKFLYTFFKLPIIFTLFSFFYEIIAFFLYLKNRKQISK